MKGALLEDARLQQGNGMPLNFQHPMMGITGSSDIGHAVPVCTNLETVQVRRLHKELPAVVDVAVRRGQNKPSHGVNGEAAVQVCQIAVVADVDRGAGVHQICNQKVGVETLRGGERTDQRVRQHRVVLQNHASRQFARELIVPLAAEDVVGNGGQVGGALADVLEQIGIIDAQAASGVEGES